MMRKLALAGLCLVAALTNIVRAQDATKTALAAIPADAVAFVYVPSIEKLDANFQQTITDLGLNIFLQPPSKYTVAGLLGEYLKITAGLDRSGSLAIVVMPFETAMEIPTKVALLIPAAEPKALLESMGGQAAEGGAWTVTVMGQPWQAVAGDKRVVLAMTPDTAKAVASSKTGIDTKLKPADLNALKGLDFAIWLDGEQVVSKFKEKIDHALNMLKIMQQAGGPMAVNGAEANKKQIEMIVEGTRAVTIGLSMGEGGLGLRFSLAIKPGSDMAKQYKVKTTTGSLLHGLPGDKYMLAFGQVIDPDQTKESLTNIDPYFAMIGDIEGIDKEQVDRIKTLFERWLVSLKGGRCSIVATPPGPDGLFAANVIVDTTDSKKWLDLVGKLFHEITNVKVEDDDIKEYIEFLTHNAEAEEIGQVKIQHIKLDVFALAKKLELEEEEIESIAKVFGKEGLVIRMGALDDKTVVIGLGGAGRMTRLIEHAKKNDATLDNDQGIKKVNAHLPKDKGGAIYVAFDQIVDLAKNIAAAMDEEMFPLQIPPIDAPFALVSSGGDEWLQIDMLLPTELMVAAKNVAMMLMGGMMGGPGPAVQPQGSGPN